MEKQAEYGNTAITRPEPIIHLDCSLDAAKKAFKIMQDQIEYSDVISLGEIADLRVFLNSLERAIDNAEWEL